MKSTHSDSPDRGSQTGPHHSDAQDDAVGNGHVRVRRRDQDAQTQLKRHVIREVSSSLGQILASLERSLFLSFLCRLAISYCDGHSNKHVKRNVPWKRRRGTARPTIVAQIDLLCSQRAKVTSDSTRKTCCSLAVLVVNTVFTLSTFIINQIMCSSCRHVLRSLLKVNMWEL